MSSTDPTGRTGMRRDEIDAAVSTERLAVADLAAGLSDEQWATPSLCTAWTVRHVVAHLTTTTRSSIGGVVAGAIRARGSFDRMEVQQAARLVERYDDAELVARLRESATSTRRMPLSKPMDPLMDVVVHAQDIARPLGITHVTPPVVVTACLDFLAGNALMGGPKRLRGVRVVAEQSHWATGDGPTVTGPDTDLLLAIAGRPAGLSALSGDGLDRFADQVTAG